jgi:hypothetical protein
MTKPMNFDNKFATRILDNSNPNKPQPIEDYADAIYRAFRCGILHEAHVSLYAVVHDDAPTIEYLENRTRSRSVLLLGRTPRSSPARTTRRVSV